MYTDVLVPCPSSCPSPHLMWRHGKSLANDFPFKLESAYCSVNLVHILWPRSRSKAIDKLNWMLLLRIPNQELWCFEQRSSFPGYKCRTDWILMRLGPWQLDPFGSCNIEEEPLGQAFRIKTIIISVSLGSNPQNQFTLVIAIHWASRNDHFEKSVSETRRYFIPYFQSYFNWLWPEANNRTWNWVEPHKNASSAPQRPSSRHKHDLSGLWAKKSRTNFHDWKTISIHQIHLVIHRLCLQPRNSEGV